VGEVDEDERVIAALAVAVACHVGGAGPMLAPDNDLACTPGSYQRLTAVQVCSSKIRPYLPAAVRRDILARYHVPAWSGADGELDHRVPLFLGGNTNRRNLWPERGPIPNAKDRLEAYVYGRVCRDRNMRVRTAVRMFLADWRGAYVAYGLGGSRAG
jgi:hypothetical protein